LFGGSLFDDPAKYSDVIYGRFYDIPSSGDDTPAVRLGVGRPRVSHVRVLFK
jgi:hypothetical protein